MFLINLSSLEFCYSTQHGLRLVDVIVQYFVNCVCKNNINNHNYTNEERLIYGMANQGAEKLLQGNERSIKSITVKIIGQSSIRFNEVLGMEVGMEGSPHHKERFT